jgi:hypothetical protein
VAPEFLAGLHVAPLPYAESEKIVATMDRGTPVRIATHRSRVISAMVPTLEPGFRPVAQNRLHQVGTVSSP